MKQNGILFANNATIRYKLLNNYNKRIPIGRGLSEAGSFDMTARLRKKFVASAALGIGALGFAVPATQAEPVNPQAQFQAATMNVADIQVPYDDLRSKDWPLSKINGAAEIFSARSKGIVFLYEDGKGLPQEQDTDLQEIKQAAQRVIAEDLPFFRIMSAKSPDGNSRLKIFIGGVEAHVYPELYSGHGGLAEGVAEDTKALYKMDQEIRLDLEKRKENQVASDPPNASLN